MRSYWLSSPGSDLLPNFPDETFGVLKKTRTLLVRRIPHIALFKKLNLFKSTRRTNISKVAQEQAKD
jgi:hypothetical protein